MSRPSCTRLMNGLAPLRHSLRPSPSTSRFQPPSSLRSHILSPSFTSYRYYAGASPFPTSRRTSILRPLNFLVVFIPIFTFSLGIWQVKRLRWKVNLIDEIQHNIERDPIILPSHINLSALPDFAFRRVLIKGVLEGPPILLGPAVEHGAPGVYLVQPFSRKSSGGSTILLNRGFITKTREKAIREGSQAPPGMDGEEIVIEGMLTKKFNEGQGKWAHDNHPEKNEWFWKDLEAMANWCGGEEKNVQPVLVDAIDYGETPPTMMLNKGTPIGRPPTIELRNQHATYAITWFSLSFATAGMLIYLLRKGSGARKLPKTVRPIT